MGHEASTHCDQDQPMKSPPPPIKIQTTISSETVELSSLYVQTPIHDKSIRNGFCERPISDRLAKLSAMFWCTNIGSMEDRLEVGVHLLNNMISIGNKNMYSIIDKHLATTDQKEKHGLKLLDMIGWIVRSLVDENASIHSLLSRLGALHEKM
eukprot:334935_1